MDQPPYLLDERRRAAVRDAIHEVCEFRRWTLLASHIRTNHVHVVVEAGVAPEKVLVDFKSYASRKLNNMRVDPPARKRWARHGSTRWLWTKDELETAVSYVVARQGAPMAVFERPLHS